MIYGTLIAKVSEFGIACLYEYVNAVFRTTGVKNHSGRGPLSVSKVSSTFIIVDISVFVLSGQLHFETFVSIHFNCFEQSILIYKNLSLCFFLYSRLA